MQSYTLYQSLSAGRINASIAVKELSVNRIEQTLYTHIIIKCNLLLKDDHKVTAIPFWALCRLLEANCVTCSYIDKFAPFHNQMSVIHNISVKFLQTLYFYRAGSARKIDAQLNF